MATIFDEILKQAKAGNTEAQIRIAEAYFKGQGVMVNYLEALHWLTKAADKNKYASIQITKMYREGIGVKADLKKAFEISLKYANKGNEIQMFELAGYYLNGVGVEADLDSAISWYEKSYEAGYKDSAYFLGYIYQTNEKVKDIHKTVEWYTKAADNNDPRACYNLGYLYFEGSSVLKNNEKALVYLKKALSLGIKEAEIIIDKINNESGYFTYSMLV